MKATAVERAQHELGRAKEAVSRLEAAPTLDDASNAWVDFLTAAGRIYSKLEQGAKSSGKSSAWFGRKKHERKTDPLLSYLHHARNSNEHGIDEVTERQSGSFSLRSTNPMSPMIINAYTGSADGSRPAWISASSPDPENKPIFIVKNPRLKLVAVTDIRFGDRFEPPKIHFGSKIDDESPLGVASLGIAYLEQLVTEAGQFPE